jgi:hypothetical protein
VYHPKAKGYTRQTLKQRALAPVVAVVDRGNTRLTFAEGTQSVDSLHSVSCSPGIVLPCCETKFVFAATPFS